MISRAARSSGIAHNATSLPGVAGRLRGNVQPPMSFRIADELRVQQVVIAKANTIIRMVMTAASMAPRIQR